MFYIEWSHPITGKGAATINNGELANFSEAMSEAGAVITKIVKDDEGAAER